MTIPLPEPSYVIGGKGYSGSDMRAYGKAVRAEEREWWREIAEQLIACHDEPTCPAVRLARERLAAIRSAAPPQCTAPPPEPQ